MWLVLLDWSLTRALADVVPSGPRPSGPARPLGRDLVKGVTAGLDLAGFPEETVADF